MERAAKPSNEQQRIKALQRLNILDTEPEERFDRITRIAQRLFDVPIALVSLIDSDRQWFKSNQGLESDETSRDSAFCAHAILSDEIMIVENTAEDVRFIDNPLVTQNPFIKFYLGCPLKINNKYNVGTLCLIDRKKRVFKKAELAIMRDLANTVVAELEALLLSTTDELTGLYNRRGFLSIANPIFEYCHRENIAFTLSFFDLNKFKDINDNFGHSEGDLVLQNFALSLQENFQSADIISRLGGDEFCILSVGVSAEVISLSTESLAEALLIKTQDNYRTVFSFGCVEYNAARHGNLERMMGDADAAMYAHKKNNANQED